MSSDELTIETSVIVDAAPEIAWQYLTSSDHVPQWLGCMRYQKQAGHVFYMQQDEAKRAAGDIEGATHCEILRLEEPREFAFSWYLPGMPPTRVDVSLTPTGESTEVTLRHSGWDQFDPAEIKPIRDGLANGWKAFVLPNLKRLVEARR